MKRISRLAPQSTNPTAFFFFTSAQYLTHKPQRIQNEDSFSKRSLSAPYSWARSNNWGECGAWASSNSKIICRSTSWTASTYQPWSAWRRTDLEISDKATRFPGNTNRWNTRKEGHGEYRSSSRCSAGPKGWICADRIYREEGNRRRKFYNWQEKKEYKNLRNEVVVCLPKICLDICKSYPFILLVILFPSKLDFRPARSWSVNC